MSRPPQALWALLTLLVGAAGCGDCGGPTEPEVVVYTSVDQVFSQPVFRACGQETHQRVRAVFDTEETKSTGVLNRLIAEADAPQADVFWSGDPVRPFVLMERNLVEPYVSPVASEIPRAFRAQDGSWTGLAARARVLLVNTGHVDPDVMPTSIRDLAAPRWRAQTAIANPLFGTTTAHVAALFSAWGDDEGRAFMDSLKQNEVRVASSNGEVARLVVSGEVAFGLVDTDDAFEARESGAHVAIVYPDQDGMGTLVMPTSVVLMRGAPHAEAGRRLIDCLLGADVERRLAEEGGHIPLRSGVATPEGVRSADEIRAMPVDYSQLALTMNRIEPWLRQWVGL
ncbi:MAG: extracellular solute-binding protein [Deltaproteobacteria bacterium]|nr:extracellular solute-binding protein [Deltaproteobacteria bacterium]